MGDIINIEFITENLKSDSFSFIYKTVCPSTNSELLEIARQGANEFTVLCAGSQTQGTGRHGRKFFSPEGTGIYMSIILKPTLDADDCLLITPMSAVCVSKAISKVLDVDAKIKWVNDIYVNDKKVCGILAQAAHINGQYTCVLGIGVNVYKPEEEFPRDIRDKAGYLCDGEKGNLREMLIAEILNNIHSYYTALPDCNFYGYYCEKSILTGRDAEIIFPNRIEKARITGIDRNFRLTGVQNGKKVTFDSGEVSVRL